MLLVLSSEAKSSSGDWDGMSSKMLLVMWDRMVRKPTGGWIVAQTNPHWGRLPTFDLSLDG